MTDWSDSQTTTVDSPSDQTGWSDAPNPTQESIRLSKDIPPEKAAQVLNLSSRTGLPTDFVSRNADALQKQQDNAALTPQFSRDNPVVSSHIASDPHHAALIGPDATLWGNVEQQFNYMGQQEARGILDTQSQLLKGMKLFGYSGGEERIKQIDIEKQYGLNAPAPGPISNAFGKVMEGAPAMLAAGGVGALLAVVGPPAGLGAATAWGFLGAGDAYYQYKNMKDGNGNPVDDHTARGFAMATGVAQTAAFAMGGKILEEIPGLKMFQQEGIKTLISSPTIMSAMKEIVTDIGKTSLTMGGYSAYANLATNAYGELAKMKSDGSLYTANFATILDRMFSKENLESAAKSGASGMQTGLILGGMGGAVDSVADYNNYSKGAKERDLYYLNNLHNAMATSETWKNIGTAIGNTQMGKLAPDQVEKLVSKITPDSYVYHPLDQWQTYWKDKGVDPRTVFQAVVGNTRGYDESLRTGVDLQIPAGKYAATIAQSEHGDFFTDHLRGTPDAMNADEAKKSLGLTKDIEKEEKEKQEAADKVKSSISGEKIPEPLPAPETQPITPTPEAQSVVDAHEQLGFKPLFPRPTAEGMSIDLAGKYREAIERATGKAQEDLVRQRADAELKQKSNSWQEERKKVQKDVETEVDNDSGQRALNSLRKHQAPDGAELARLSRTDIEKDYPELSYALEKLPEGSTIKEGGIHPDDAAMRLGYNSGSELLHDLMTMPDRDMLIKQITDERMIQRHPEAGSMFGTSGNVVEQAMDAVHNENRAKVLRLELEHLSSDDFMAFKGLLRKVGRPLPSNAEMKADAEREIGSKTTAETQPLLYQRAESVAGREAHEYVLKGDWDNAFESRRQELVNALRYNAARDAKEQAAKDLGFARRFDNDSSRARLGKAGADYLEQIDAIREAFDFSKTTNKALESRKSLRDWVQQQQEAGYNPTVPPDLLEQANKKSWKDMTNDELHSTVDSMRNIAHLASLKNKLLASVKERTFEETTQSIVDALQNRYSITPQMLDKPYDLHPDFSERVKGALNTYGAWRTRMEPLFEQLGLHDIIFDPLNEAEDTKTSKMRDATQHMKDMFSDYSTSEKAKFGRLTYIPELEGSGLSPNLNKMEMIMSLLHGGNEGNMREVMRGYKMNETQLRAIWSNLEPRDLTLAQNVWDFVNSYWPQIEKQERELNGLTPEKIEGRPLDVTLKDGSVHHLDGGYFPLVYDKDVSWRTAALGQDATVKDLFPSYASNTATKHNWTEARVGGGGQAPSLKFNVLTNHVFDVIHDLAYRKPVIDTYKLLNDDTVRANIEAGAGKGVYSQMNPWIKRMAGDRQWEPMGPFEAIRQVRSNMTVAELGLKLGSALVHTTSLFPATRELGMDYMAQGFKQFQDVPKATQFMWDKSEFMRSRWEDVGDRDIRSAAGSLNLVNSKNGFWNELKAMSPIEQRDAWIIMRCADMAIAGPTWHGAYLRAMDGKVRGIEAESEPEAISYADQLVRDTKGSGAAKDLAPIQTVGGSFGKLLTMFYTQLNVIDNQMMGAYRQFKVDRNIGKVAGAALMSWFAPAVASQLLRGRTPKSDESWLSFGGKAIGKFPLELMPITREAMSAVERGRYQLSPVEEALTTIAKTGVNIATKNSIADKLTENDTEWTKKDYSDAMMSLGYLKGIPTRQVVQSTMRLHGWMSGEEPHENPIGGLWSVATGVKPNE